MLHFCGSSRSALRQRATSAKRMRYAFIHRERYQDSGFRELFGDNMQFGVVIGNPPTS